MAMPLAVAHSPQILSLRSLSPCRARRGGTRVQTLAFKVGCQHSGAPNSQIVPARQQWLARAPSSSIVCHDSSTPHSETTRSSTSSSADSTKAGSDSTSLAISSGLLALWAALLSYVFILAPNQTPSIDAFVVQKLVGLKADDPFQVNTVFTAVWNFMGLYPLIYAAILIPGARSDKLPAWPFVCASVFLGAYALIPYMCLWSPKNPPQQLPPPQSELEGWNKFYMRAAEAPWLPLGLLAGSAYWLYVALTAGTEQWLGYLQFFDESRLAHATSIDFMLCTLLLPFWLNNDAEGRKWEQRNTLVPLLSLLPLVGPCIYLLLRPKAYSDDSSSSSS